MRHADAAMYSAKSEGRGRWAQLDADRQDVGPSLARRLREAVPGGRLALLYQRRALGCDAAQGYLLGRPVPAEDLTLD